MKRTVIFIIAIIFSLTTFAHTPANNLPAIKPTAASSTKLLTQSPKKETVRIITNTPKPNRQDRYEKPVYCVLIVEVNGKQYIGEGEGVSLKEACNNARNDAYNKAGI